MSEMIDGQEWLQANLDGVQQVYVGRALEWLMANDKVAALWISGSRASGEADAHSDTDIRAHAPGWNEADTAGWLRAVGANPRPLVRLSRLGPAVLNYECLFGADVEIDLQIFPGEQPVIAFGSLLLKGREPLPRQPGPQWVREAPIGAAELRNLMDGATIDQKKFGKLLARGERLAALFLLDAQRYALLRLAYIATRGMDCGARPVHTLASLRVVRRVLEQEAVSPIRAGVQRMADEGSIEEKIAGLGALMEAVFAGLHERPA